MKQESEIQSKIDALQEKIYALQDEKDGYPKRAMGAKIKKARLAHGYTQVQLADLCEINRTTLTNIEGGFQAVTSKHLCKLCKLLSLSADDLLGLNKVKEEQK